MDNPFHMFLLRRYVRGKNFVGDFYTPRLRTHTWNASAKNTYRITTRELTVPAAVRTRMTHAPAALAGIGMMHPRWMV